LLTTVLSFAQMGKDKSKAGGDVKQQIMQMMDEGRQAALKGDTTWSEKHMADDYHGVTAMGEVIGSKSEAVSRMKAGKVKYESIDVEEKDARVHGDSAVYTGRAKVKATREGQDISGEYRNTWFWAKQGGQWKLVASQSTKVMGEASK
jgi:hypothetical protein